MSVRSADTVDTAHERGRAVTALINADLGPSSPPPRSKKPSGRIGHFSPGHNATCAKKHGHRQQDEQQLYSKGFAEQHDNRG